MCNFGTRVEDLVKPFHIRTQRYQFEHPSACLQNTTNLHQNNFYDIHLPNSRLVNIESDLRGISRKLSKLPQSRYRSKILRIGNYGISAFEPIREECAEKIVR